MATYFVDDTLGNDGNAGTSAGAGNAWKTLGFAAGAMADDDLINAKNTSDYVITGAITWPKRGLIRGYNSSPGDGGKFICRTVSDSIGLFNIGSDGVSLQDGYIKHQASTRGLGIYTSSGSRSSLLLKNFKIEGCTRGIDSDFIANYDFYAPKFQNIEIIGCTVYGIIIRGSCSIVGGIFRNNATSINLTTFGNGVCRVFSKLIIANSINYGIHAVGTSSLDSLNLDQCIIYGSGSHGIYYNGSTISLLVNDSIIYNNGGRGLEADGALRHSIRNTAFGANSSGPYNTTYFLPDYITREITLTADPFVDAANLDFNINNTAGGGALLRASNYDLAG